MLKRISIFAMGLACLALHAQTSDAVLKLRDANAWQVPQAQTVSINSATLAGNKVIAVGAKGGIVLSDDGGKNWHQAKQVPTGSTLTGISFVNDKLGWVAGHNGVILATDDGGETWKRQHWDSSVDQPFFGIKFINENVGVAVGLWSLILRTVDGGKSWQPVTLPAPPVGAKKDLNFFQIFGDKNHLFIAAEAGWVLQSNDAGAHWNYQNVVSKASLWTGAAAGDDVWVAGLLGKTFHSSNSGKTWQPVDAGMKASVTAIRIEQDQIEIIGLDGNLSTSDDGGKNFSHTQRPDRAALTEVLILKKGSALYFSSLGVIAP